MKRLVYILFLFPLTLVSQDLYVIDSSSTYYLTDSSQTYYIYHDLSEQALLYLDGTVSTINNKIDTIFDENNNFNAIQTDTLKSPSLTDGSKEYDGVDDYMNVGTDNSLFPNDISISVWFKASDVGNENQEGIVSNKIFVDGININLKLGEISTFIGNGTNNRYVKSGVTPNENQWYHVAVTHNSSTNLTTIYVNGDEKKNETFAIAYNANPRMTISRWYSNTDAFYFKGSIDEVMIFDRPLQPSEITELYEKCDTIGGILNCD